jgi:hypothetical protein
MKSSGTFVITRLDEPSNKYMLPHTGFGWTSGICTAFAFVLGMARAWP